MADPIGVGCGRVQRGDGGWAVYLHMPYGLTDILPSDARKLAKVLIQNAKEAEALNAPLVAKSKRKRGK